MKKQITIDKAIRMGQLILLNSLLVVVILWIVVLAFLQEYLTWWAIPILLLLVSPVISGLILSFLLRQWKFWAFENVRNVHELKKRAAQALLTYENDKFFKKVAESTRSDERRWNIKQKLLQDDIFIDDLLIPATTYVYHSTVHIYFYLVLLTFLLGGIAYTYTENIFMGGAVACVVAIVFLLLNRAKLKREYPQIVLSNKGIETIEVGFTPWENIKNEQVVMARAGKLSNAYLAYEVGENQISMSFIRLNIGDQRLAKLLILYRNRYIQQSK